MTTRVRWNPAREMAAMQNVMDQWFENGRPSTPATHNLALDVYESDGGYVIYTALPGVNPENINVSVEDDVLTISGEVAKPSFDEKDNVRTLVQERTSGKFARSIRVNTPVESDKIEAAYENGLLKLTLPKTPAAQPRQIPVKASKN